MPEVMPDPFAAATFLAFANPKLDPKSLIRPKRGYPPSTSPVIELRNLLTEQPDLAKFERLPASLALTPSEKSILFNPREGYLFVPEFEFWIPNRHRFVLDLLRKEMSDGRFHGDSSVYSTCRGPMCRRVRNEYLHESHKLRQAYKTRRPTSLKPAKRLPQYAAVDPLITSFLIRVQHNQTLSQPTAKQKEYQLIISLSQLRYYLHLTYGERVQ